MVDYVRMLRARTDVDWSKLLRPIDLGYLVQRIDSAAWYPMETFERMGIAILAAIAQGQLDPVRMFGRASVDWLSRTQAPSLHRETHATPSAQDAPPWSNG